MIPIELTLYILAYTTLIIALFLEVICFRRKMESVEMIAFTFSLLLLVVSISTSPLLGVSEIGATSNIFTLLSMVAVAATTLLNVINERKYYIKPILKKVHLATAMVLFTAAIITHFTGHLLYIQYAIVTYLVLSVFFSMLMVRTTKPLKIYQHLEKTNRIFSIAFMTLVPLYLGFHYGFEEQYEMLPIGFLLPIAFSLLAMNKIFDDLQRLSIVKNGIAPQIQHFKNYNLTERECEIAILLIKGTSYQKIAELLFISMPTVKTHASNIYKKCNVNTRHELTFLLTP